MGKRITLIDVKDFLSKDGLKILDENEYINSKIPFTSVTKEGYYIYQSFSNMRKGHPPLKFSKHNPHTLRNIKEIWLPSNEPNIELLDTQYINATTKMMWRYKDTGVTFQKSWGTFQYGERDHPKIAREKAFSKRRRKSEEVRKEITGYLNDLNLNEWCLVEGEECNTYRNTQTPLKFINKQGYYAMYSLLQFQQGKAKMSLYNSNYPDESTYNMKRFLELNTDYRLAEGQHYHGDGKYKFICTKHNKEFETEWYYIRQLRLSCRACYSEKYSGENSSKYNPNLTEEERTIGRNIEGYSEWRKAVYERDNYTCQCCGDSKGGNLVAHHLDGYDWCKEKRININNGITLCDYCHTDFHMEYGYGDNTKEQFDEFKTLRTALRLQNIEEQKLEITPEDYLHLERW